MVSANRSESKKKLFTVEAANATLPLVRAITRDMVELAREVAERRHRLSTLLVGRRECIGDPYHEELAQIEDELNKDATRLQEYVDELRDLGVEPKSIFEGLVDFPAMMDGREVYLCWRLDEPEVLHWHEISAGFEGRQSLSRPGPAGKKPGSVAEPAR